MHAKACSLSDMEQVSEKQRRQRNLGDLWPKDEANAAGMIHAEASFGHWIAPQHICRHH